MINVKPPPAFAQIEEFRSVREISVPITSCNGTSVILEQNSIHFNPYVKMRVVMCLWHKIHLQDFVLTRMAKGTEILVKKR
jgi:hypothetical protein